MQRFRKLWHVVRDFTARNQANAVEAYAAQAALFVVISFFPAAMLLLTLLPHLPFTESQVANAFARIIPDAITDFVRSFLQELYDGAPVSVTIITVALALWAASKGSVALMRGLDRIYGVHRTRGFLVLRLLASVYVLIFFVLLIVILAFLGFGGVVFNWLAQLFPVLASSMLVKRGLQSLVAFAVLFLLFWFLYVAVPRQHTHFLRQTPGALVAAGGWVGFSSLYSLYLDTIGGRSSYYGSLSIVMFALLWLYFCMYIFFVGAEINVWIAENLPKKK